MITVSTRLDEKILKEIEAMAHEMNIEKGVLIRKYILDGHKQNLLKKHIQMIHNNEISIGQAAESVEVPVYQIINTARALGIEIGANVSTIPYELNGIQKRLD